MLSALDRMISAKESMAWIHPLTQVLKALIKDSTIERRQASRKDATRPEEEASIKSSIATRIDQGINHQKRQRSRNRPSQAFIATSRYWKKENRLKESTVTRRKATRGDGSLQATASKTLIDQVIDSYKKHPSSNRRKTLSATRTVEESAICKSHIKESYCDRKIHRKIQASSHSFRRLESPTNLQGKRRSKSRKIHRRSSASKG